jgi:hypothetical protein
MFLSIFRLLLQKLHGVSGEDHKPEVHIWTCKLCNKVMIQLRNVDLHAILFVLSIEAG